MHHLFVVPEIVAVIVKSGSLCKGYLYTCLLVNRVFFQESARLLWYACGRGVWTPSETGHALANFEHLISVSRKDPQRAQMYANFICILQFSEWFEGTSTATSLNGTMSSCRYNSHNSRQYISLWVIALQGLLQARLCFTMPNQPWAIYMLQCAASFPTFS
jgi:hypothetical protein